MGENISHIFRTLVIPGFQCVSQSLTLHVFNSVPSGFTTEVTLSNSMLYQISHEKGISALTSWRNLLDVAKQISFQPFECTKLGKSTKKIQMIIMTQYVLIKQPFQYLLSSVRDKILRYVLNFKYSQFNFKTTFCTIFIWDRKDWFQLKSAEVSMKISWKLFQMKKM